MNGMKKLIAGIGFILLSIAIYGMILSSGGSGEEGFVEILLLFEFISLVVGFVFLIAGVLTKEKTS